jgi:uncharacterized protein YbjT (DUF2867 family)
MFKELVTVFGVTGKQGGSVANYVLGDEELSQQYSVRGVTHSPSISKVRALKSKGALIIEADLDKPSRFPCSKWHLRPLLSYKRASRRVLKKL